MHSMQRCFHILQWNLRLRLKVTCSELPLEPRFDQTPKLRFYSITYFHFFFTTWQVITHCWEVGGGFTLQGQREP